MKTFEEVLASGALNLNLLEQSRQEQLQIEKKKIRIGLIVILVIIFISLIISIIANAYPLIIIVAFIAGIGFLIFMQSVKKNYIISAKENVVKQLVNTIHDSFAYHPRSFIPKDVFRESQFVKSFNTYSGEDYFFGNINDNIPAEFSELLVQIRSKNSSTTLFQGIFFSVQFSHNFEGRTAAVPDTLEKGLGKFGRALQNLSFRRDPLLKINDEAFESEFAIYSTNEIEANKILHPNLRTYLIDLKTLTGGAVYFSYSGNRFYLGLFNRKDLFGVNIKVPLDESILRQYYNDLVNNLNIVLHIYSILEENIHQHSGEVTF